MFCRKKVRLSLCVGGGGRSAGFSKVVSSNAAMDTFANEVFWHYCIAKCYNRLRANENHNDPNQQLFAALEKYDLDGADLDWVC